MTRKKIINCLLASIFIMLSGCSDVMHSYNPLEEDNAPIEGYNEGYNKEDYSWNNETNGYSDPYGQAQEQAISSTGYNVSYAGRNLPNSPSYFNSHIGNTVHFDVDSIGLNENAKDILRAQAQWLGQHHHKILVEGYTDNRGTKVYNIALGKHRASAVKSYLVSLGIPQNSIKTISYGLERPVALCQQEKCWAKNRRAHIVLY